MTISTYIQTYMLVNKTNILVLNKFPYKLRKGILNYVLFSVRPLTEAEIHQCVLDKFQSDKYI